LALALSISVHGIVLAFHTDWFLWIELVCPGIFTMRVLKENLVVDTVAWPTQRKTFSLVREIACITNCRQERSLAYADIQNFPVEKVEATCR